MTEDQRRRKAFAQYLSDELAQLWRAGTKRVERARTRPRRNLRSVRGR